MAELDRYATVSGHSLAQRKGVIPKSVLVLLLLFPVRACSMPSDGKPIQPGKANEQTLPYVLRKSGGLFQQCNQPNT